jgi:hypothetical protein
MFFCAYRVVQLLSSGISMLNGKIYFFDIFSCDSTSEEVSLKLECNQQIFSDIRGK